MKIAMSPTREKYPLSTKKVLKKTITGTFMLIVPLLIFIVILYFITQTNTFLYGLNFGNIMVGILLFCILLLTITYLYQQWYYAVYYYNFQDEHIVIKKGPIIPREITIPYTRIQDIYVDQDILDRIFGLYDVHVSSATISSGEQAHIDGVEKAAADGLRAFLLDKISTQGRK